MKSIVIFGAGNVATHLFHAFSKARDFRVIQVYNHRQEGLENFNSFCKTTTNINEVEPADVYLIAVKDDVIPAIANSIRYKNALTLHTSGGVSLDVLNDFPNSGVFYPVQTFSQYKPLDFNLIPVCIEVKVEEDISFMEKLAGNISNRIFKINSEQRKSLHLAAVFVNNFVNHLYAEGEEICNKNNIPFEILHPLIEETAAKAIIMRPEDAQTGPAKRNDQAVINSHLSLLDPEQQKIYKLLTQSIRNLHGKEL